MDKELVFWLFVTIGVIEVIGIFTLSFAVSKLLRSDFFQKKMERARENKSLGNSGMANAITLLIALGLPLLSSAFSIGTEDNPLNISVDTSDLYLMLVIDLILFAVILYMRRLLNTLLNIDKTEEEIRAAETTQVLDLGKILTDRVAIEKEHTILLDHEYDGIKELDNNLPPWWKWGFYLTIGIGIVYLFHFHAFKTGDLQIEAYNKTMAQAELDIQAYLESQAMNVDEKTATLLTSESDLSAGKDIYMQYCKVCHLDQGQGLVGPNFADAYWIYGNDIKDLFKVIKYGATRGMKSWKDELNPIQMQQVASFIKTFEGTNPPNPKDPEGELMTAPSEESAPIDSLEVTEEEELRAFLE